MSSKIKQRAKAPAIAKKSPAKKQGVPKQKASSDQSGSSSVEEIRVDQIVPASLNRKISDEDPSVKSLADSIKVRGLLQAIRVRGSDKCFEIVFGERRWRAVRLLGMPTIRATVVDCDAREAAVDRLIENLQREDIPPIEQAEAIQAMLDAHNGSVKEVARRLGKCDGWVRVRARLANLIPEWRAELSRPNTAYAAIAHQIGMQEMIAALPSSVQSDLIQDRNFLANCTTTAEMRRRIESLTRVINHAPWNDSRPLDAAVCRYAAAMAKTGGSSISIGTCDRCDCRTDREPVLWRELLGVVNGDVRARCLDSTCWLEKFRWFIKMRIQEAMESGQEFVVLYKMPSPFGRVQVDDSIPHYYPGEWILDGQYDDAHDARANGWEERQGLCVDGDNEFLLIYALVRPEAEDAKRSKSKRKPETQSNLQADDAPFQTGEQAAAVARAGLYSQIAANWPCPSLSRQQPIREAFATAARILVALELGYVVDEDSDDLFESLHELTKSIRDSASMLLPNVETVEQVKVLRALMGYEL
jgi:ParB/RepB/Spo0J family partition protein